MANPSQPADPQPLMGLGMTPLVGVALSLLALWIVALPPPSHSVSLDISGNCGGPVAVEPVVHTVVIDFDDAITWNGEALAGRGALNARLQAVAAQAMTDRLEVHVHPHKLASFGSVAAVLASAQRNGVRKLGLIGQGFTWLQSGWGGAI